MGTLSSIEGVFGGVLKGFGRACERPVRGCGGVGWRLVGPKLLLVGKTCLMVVVRREFVSEGE